MTQWLSVSFLYLSYGTGMAFIAFRGYAKVARLVMAEQP